MTYTFQSDLDNSIFNIKMTRKAEIRQEAKMKNYI